MVSIIADQRVRPADNGTTFGICVFEAMVHIVKYFYSKISSQSYQKTLEFWESIDFIAKKL